ncbi:MAG TPA: hypothetical protein VN639_18550 [Azonexus sp.]|nr:hypothetical protein [Azonexus sp.]
MNSITSLLANQDEPLRTDLRHLGRILVERVARGIHPTINGIASGLRNSG